MAEAAASVTRRPDAQDGSAPEAGGRSRVIFGALPDDFLRLMVEVPVPQQELDMLPPALRQDAPLQGMLRVTVLQAKLAKNYGLFKMDPFVQVHVGPYGKRTSVCEKGSTEPRWNQMLELPVLQGFGSLLVEVLDFRTMGDKVIARGEIALGDLVDELPHEEWFHLSGKQGQDKEGVIRLHLHFNRTAQAPVAIFDGLPMGAVLPPGILTYPPLPPAGMAPMHPAVYAMPPMMQQPAMPPAPAPLPFTDAQVDQLHEMFPGMEREVVGSVMVANKGNMDAALNALLSMQTS